jgi:DNA-binding PadR family transcriptional regulator
MGPDQTGLACWGVTLPDSTYVTLGLLAKRPGSGYDTASLAERSISYFWPISRTQLYHELARLEQLGWANGTAVVQDRYPDKRVYEPTAAGLAALRGWLDDAFRPRRQRGQETIVLKVFLGSFMTPERLTAQLREHREQADRLRSELSGVVAHLEAKGPGPQAFGLAAARYGVLRAEAAIAWTEEVQALLEQHQVMAD